MIDHGGDIDGFSSADAIVLDDGLEIALLSNADRIDLEPLGKSIVALIDAPRDANLVARVGTPAENENPRITAAIRTILGTPPFAVLGELRSIEFVERSRRNGVTYDEYRLNFAAGQWWLTFGYRRRRRGGLVTLRTRHAMMRCAAIVVAAAVLALCVPGLTGAETLVVPLTGERVRDIQTERLFHGSLRISSSNDDATTLRPDGRHSSDVAARRIRRNGPFLRYQSAYPVLRARFAGVIERNARNILTDVYANALQSDYHIWERKWEVDSLAWTVVLASVYWRDTRDRSIFTRISIERCPDPSTRIAAKSTIAPATDTAIRSALHAGRIQRQYGNRLERLRPSDDAVQYRFNIPQNALAVVGLRDVEQLARIGYGDETLAHQAQALEARVQVGIERYGRISIRAEAPGSTCMKQTGSAITT